MSKTKDALAEDLDAIDPAAIELDKVRARLAVKTTELTQARTTIKAIQRDLDEARVLSDFLAEPLEQAPGWLKPLKRRPKPHRGTIVTILSDLHLDEVVNPEELKPAGVNAYNRAIAEARLERYFNGLVTVARQYWAGREYDGVVVLMAGDTLTGNLHDLAETNEAPVPASIRHWTPRIGDGLQFLAEEFGRVHVAATPGNHGRFTMKPRTKQRALDNADWLIAGLIEDRFKNDERITFNVPDSPDALVQVYDTNILLTHGDQVNGGQGIGGVWPPLMRLQSRKRDRFAFARMNFDVMAMGHWHTYIPAAQGLWINGSLKGYDEFAGVMNFRPERAQQAMALVTPEHGITEQSPILVADAKAEGWAKYR